MIRFCYLKVPFTKIRISLTALLTAAALFYADFSVFTAMVFISAILHECGHIVFLKAFGTEIYGITVLPFGAVIRSDAAKLSYRREAAVALAGALFNLAAAGAAGLFFCICRDIHPLFFCGCNLLLAAVNLVPVKTLDGGRALEAALCARLSPEKAQRYMESVSYVAFVFLTLAALVLLTVTGCNFSLIIFCVYLFVCVYVCPERSNPCMFGAR